ncbi:MAG: hypothetical protein AAFX03_09990 [Pseudomonadota bacterium]
MRVRLASALAAMALVSACGAGGQEPGPAAGDAEADPTPQPRSAGLSGELILEVNEPLEAVRIIRYDLETRRYVIEVDGSEARWANAKIVFTQPCGAHNTGERLAIADADGFVTPASPCDEDSIRTNLHSAAISFDGARVAAVDTEMLLEPIDPDEFMSAMTAARGQGVRVYDESGDEIGVLPGYASPAWTRDGDLIVAGTGKRGEAPYGIYKASADYKSVSRIDDGRLNNTIWSLVGHPQANKAAFVYNYQIWEIDLASGAPKRRVVFDFPIAYVAYSPDGRRFAFVVADPLEQGLKRGGDGVYYLHVFDGENVVDIPVDFIAGGPITWIAD